MTNPPFRADQVGSLLRPKELADARKAFKAGTLEGPKLKEIEDRCIREAIARQEAIGLESITDGVVVAGERQSVVIANAAAERILGLPRERLRRTEHI